MEREEGAAAAADGGDEKSGPRSEGGMREWIGGRRRAGMQDQGFRGNSLEKRKEENIRWIGKEG